MRLELLPAFNAEERVAEAELLAVLRTEREAEVGAERRFFECATAGQHPALLHPRLATPASHPITLLTPPHRYAKAWWQRYLAEGPHFKQRPVRDPYCPRRAPRDLGP